jgi:multiple sugar transport system permease protein
LVLIQSDNLKPVTLGLVMLQGQWVSSYNLIAAGAIIAAAAPIAIFLFFQRYFIQGLTVGAIKG